MNTMKILKLKTSYPCCEGISIIRMIECVPRQRYIRKCTCGTVWDVKRSTLCDNNGIRMDELVWERGL